MRRRALRTRIRAAAHRRRQAMGERLAVVHTASDAMVARADDGVRRGTRMRAGFLAGAGFVSLLVMFTAVSQNVLAVNFTTSNTSYKIYTDQVSGTHAAGFLNVQDLYGATDDGVLQLGIKTATLNGLCAIAKQTLPVIGEVSLLITAGEPVDGSTTNPVGQTIQANQIYLASDSLGGGGDQIAKITLGQSADTLMMDTLPYAGSPGAFGLQVQSLNLSNLDADSYGIDLQGQVNLPNLKIKVVPGAKAKADCNS